MKKTTYFHEDDLYFTTDVNIKNIHSSTIYGKRLYHVFQTVFCVFDAVFFADVYYMRNVDPDQEQPWSGNFATYNYVRSRVADQRVCLTRQISRCVLCRSNISLTVLAIHRTCICRLSELQQLTRRAHSQRIQE